MRRFALLAMITAFPAIGVAETSEELSAQTAELIGKCLSSEASSYGSKSCTAPDALFQATKSVCLSQLSGHFDEVARRFSSTPREALISSIEQIMDSQRRSYVSIIVNAQIKRGCP